MPDIPVLTPIRLEELFESNVPARSLRVPFLWLPATIVSFNVAVPKLAIPPALPKLLLALKVLLVTLTVPPEMLAMPPPVPPVLPLNVLFVTVSVAKLMIPPPPPAALFPLTVLLASMRMA